MFYVSVSYVMCIFHIDYIEHQRAFYIQYYKFDMPTASLQS